MTRPSIDISPPLISSSPASMRSSVDLPQPEGPTSTTNSPSLMSKLIPWMILTLPKLFSILSNATDAICVFLFLAEIRQLLTAPAVRPDTM